MKKDSTNDQNSCNNLNFVLSKHGGFYIETIDGLRLSTTEDVTTFWNQSISFVSDKHAAFTQPKYNIWQFVSTSTDKFDYFAIQLSYGER